MEHSFLAYIDPGSGSYFFQLLVAGMLGFIYVLKTYWRNTTSFFSRIAGRKQKNDE